MGVVRVISLVAVAAALAGCTSGRGNPVVSSEAEKSARPTAQTPVEFRATFDAVQARIDETVWSLATLSPDACAQLWARDLPGWEEQLSRAPRRALVAVNGYLVAIQVVLTRCGEPAPSTVAQGASGASGRSARSGPDDDLADLRSAADAVRATLDALATATTPAASGEPPHPSTTPLPSGTGSTDRASGVTTP